ncbi:MAG TPA: TolC family protein [Polyangiales bacterium]|nr:TolC family protein [Polyangiales bacterium]
MRGIELLVLLSACTGASTAGDVHRVRTLANAPVLAKAGDESVSPTTDGDARKLLQQPVDAERAVRIALLNNRALRAELRELGVSRGRLMQAGLIGNPTFEVELLPERDSDVELRAEYDLSTLIRAPLASRAASAELEAEQLRVAGSVVELGYRVRAAWFELAAAQQRLNFAQRTLDALTAGRDAAVALLEAGNIAPLEASRQIVAYENARIEVARHELALADQREHMQRLLGLYGEETTWQLAGQLAELPAAPALPDKLETAALTANLDLKALGHRLEAAARRTGFTRTAGWLPGVEVDVHALHTDPDAQHMDGNRWRYGGGVSVGVPLFDRQQGELRANEAEFDALLEREQGLAIDLRSQARAARNRVLSTHARANAYQSTLVPAQRTVVEQTVLQFNAMQANVFELLSARRAELEIELAAVDARAAYWTAQAALDALIAGKLVEQEDEADEHTELRSH